MREQRILKAGLANGDTETERELPKKVFSLCCEPLHGFVDLLVHCRNRSNRFKDLLRKHEALLLSVGEKRWDQVDCNKLRTFELERAWDFWCPDEHSSLRLPDSQRCSIALIIPGGSRELSLQLGKQLLFGSATGSKRPWMSNVQSLLELDGDCRESLCLLIERSERNA